MSYSVLKPKDLAVLLGVSLRLVYRQIRTGTIPSVKCGDRYLILKVMLEKWLSGEGPAAHKQVSYGGTNDAEERDAKIR